VTILTFPHCYVHIVDMHVSLQCPSSQEMVRAGIFDVETTARLGYQLTIQVPEAYHPTRKFRCNFGTHCEIVDPQEQGELYQPARWDRHSGYLWFDAPSHTNLKEAFKMLMLELAVIGWWELAEEIYETTMAQATRRCDA
jgi:hypothetical protein